MNLLSPERCLLVSWVLVSLLASLVHAKGSKLRPKQQNQRYNERDGRGGEGRGGQGVSSAGGADGASDDSVYPTAYLFRNATSEEQLLSRLFREYDPIARAVMDVALTVAVSIDFVLLRIHGLVSAVTDRMDGLDERSQVLTTTGLVIVEWQDDRLTWTPGEFGNLTDMIVKPDQIWLPEVALMNGADELMPDYFDRMRVLLRHDGRLHWEPGGVFRTTCDIDITYFPFDTQHCPLLIGAYSYHSSRMNVTNASPAMLTHDLQPNGEWHVTGSSVQWNVSVLGQSGDGYAHVIFTLHLERRCKFYLMNIVLPCLMLSSLIMVGFLLPPESGEKISLGISVLLAFTVFLMMIADNIPRTSLAIPLIVIYLTATMTLGTTSICLTVLVLNVHHRASAPSPRPFPPCLRRLLLIHLARLVRCRTTPLSAYRNQSARSAKQALLTKHRTPPVDTLQQQYPTGGFLHNGAGHWRQSLSSLIGWRVHKAEASTNHVPASNGKAGIPICCGEMDEKEKSVEEVIACVWRTDRVAHSRALRSHRTSRHKHGKAPQLDDSSSDVTVSAAGLGGEWRELAQVLDRTFFWLVCLMMTSSTLLVLFYPHYARLDDVAPN